MPFFSVDFDMDGDEDLVQGRTVYLNQSRQLEAPYLARVGRVYRLELHSQAGTAIAPQLAWVWAGTQFANTPIALSPFGVLRLDPAQLIVLPAAQLPDPAGRANVDFTIPAQPTLVEMDIGFQGVILTVSGSLRLTNLVAETIR